MNVLSIVVTYNRKKLLEECILALKSQENFKTDILIIDNASTDGTEEMVKKKFSNDVIYQNTGSNLGGAGGFNFGIKKSFDLGKEYDYLWVMDDDTIPKKDALFEILKIVEKDKKFGFISPKTLWTDGSLCLMNKQKTLEDVDNIIKNTYINLMTRGIKGCYVFCVDKKLNNYMKDELKKITILE